MVKLEDYAHLIPGESSEKDKVERLRNGFSRLTPREIEILNLRLGLDGSPKKNNYRTSESLNLTGEYTSFAYHRALKRIINPVGEIKSKFDSLPLVIHDSPMTPYDVLDKKEQVESLLEVISSLDKIEIEVLYARGYFEGDAKKSLRKIGKEYGLQHESIRNIENRAIKKICQAFEGFDKYRSSNVKRVHFSLDDNEK